MPIKVLLFQLLMWSYQIQGYLKIHWKGSQGNTGLWWQVVKVWIPKLCKKIAVLHVKQKNHKSLVFCQCKFTLAVSKGKGKWKRPNYPFFLQSLTQWGYHSSPFLPFFCFIKSESVLFHVILWLSNSKSIRMSEIRWKQRNTYCPSHKGYKK